MNGRLYRIVEEKFNEVTLEFWNNVFQAKFEPIFSNLEKNITGLLRFNIKLVPTHLREQRESLPIFFCQTKTRNKLAIKIFDVSLHVTELLDES